MNLTHCPIPKDVGRASCAAAGGRDDLTGLATRSQFARALEQALTAVWPRPSALLLIGLDGFTSINDTLSHTIGDEVLRQFAERLLRIAPSRAAVGRIGSDAFALLLAGPDNLHEAQRVVAQIGQALLTPFEVPDGPLTLSACIGVATCPVDAEETNALLQCAGIALHQARQDGHGACCLYTAAMSTGTRQRHVTEATRRPARADGGIEPQLQPAMRISSGPMVGTEGAPRHDMCAASYQCWQFPEIARACARAAREPAPA
jgi:diguanylate cyclase (GGDEF)-like protein